MKAREWQQYLEEQSRRHNKYVFTVNELANVAGTSRYAINVELNRLKKYGVLASYVHGKYGLSGRVTPEMLLPHLDRNAYISGSYALLHHQLITQEPVKITCFTNRRHGRNREVSTAAGRFVFVCVKAPIYSPPESGIYAPPEQALCDFVYLMRRSGADPRSQVTFRNLDRIETAALLRIARRYPATVADVLANILPHSLMRNKYSGF
jgi:hypothetical protein